MLRGLSVAAVVLISLLQICCGRSNNSGDAKPDYDFPDTLRVATLYSPSSYFIFQEAVMGYDYELIRSLAEEKGLVLRMEIANSLAGAIEMLDSGLVDLIAYEVPVTAEFKEHAVACGPTSVTTQVLVQPKTDSLITDVTGLVGRDVYVEADSRYEARLRNLNDETGGGIRIHPIDRDTLISEDLIAMVSDGTIPLTVVDSDIASINKTYFNDLDISLEVSFPQKSQWAVSPSRPWLADSINSWLKAEKSRGDLARLHKRYFELSKTEMLRRPQIDLNRGFISPMDKLFKQYSENIGWDWRLLAAQGYTESRFDSTLVSWAGAKGIMQVMPSTARAYGKNSSDLVNNEVSISTAVEIIKALDKALKSKVPDDKERLKFIVAAYNSGIAHIYDAIALAKKHGLNPQKWDGNVAQALMMKSKPEYFNDPVVKYGYFRGRQTFEYVRQVFDFYSRACEKIKK